MTNTYTALQHALRMAQIEGMVITVDLIPTWPPAMGDYTMHGHVRPCRSVDESYPSTGIVITEEGPQP